MFLFHVAKLTLNHLTFFLNYQTLEIVNHYYLYDHLKFYFKQINSELLSFDEKVKCNNLCDSVFNASISVFLDLISESISSNLTLKTANCVSFDFKLSLISSSLALNSRIILSPSDI